MIEKIKASTSEKVIFIFILILGLFTLTSFLLLKDKCLFVKNHDPKEINFENPNNIAILFGFSKFISFGSWFLTNKHLSFNSRKDVRVNKPKINMNINITFSEVEAFIFSIIK